MAEHSDPNAPWKTLSGIGTTAITAALFLFFLQYLPTVAAGEPVRWVIPWIPSLDVHLSFWIDGLSLMFALLITGIGALVMLYAAKYLAGHPQYDRFALYLFAFMLSMLGVVLADNLIALFVFWELTTFTSYLLIGFGHADPKSRRNALQALLLTATGGLALLAGFILMGVTQGSFEMSQINAAGSLVGKEFYTLILFLVLAGAFTKSAQVPFHFWLPNAMAAPTPVSAYLHSATMVKAGVYLLARTHPALSGSDLWIWILSIFGAVTAVFASLMALRQTDLKQTLAYTTLMALGTLVMFLAGSTGYAITAAMTFLLVHSLYKAGLFLTIGVIDHATGTRDANLLGGLKKAMPITAMAAAVAGLAMAGIPPFLGFIAKEVAYSGALEMHLWLFVVPMALIAFALMFAVAGIVAYKPFYGPQGELPHAPHEGPWPMLLGPVVLGVLGLLFGLMPGIAAHYLIEPAVHAVMGAPDRGGRVKLWAGFNMALLLSLVTFALGFLIYLRHQSLRERLARIEAKSPDLDASWDRFLDWFVRFSKVQTGLIQTGVLRQYMFATFTVFAVTVLVTLVARGAGPLRVSFSGLGIMEWGIAALITAGTVLVLMTSSRITALVGLGTVGIGVALVFITYSAPDVAITQLLVELLVVVLLALALLKMPYLDKGNVQKHSFPNAVLAIAVGALTTWVLLLVVDQPFDRRLTEFFEGASWTQAFGRNIVNVILVDFRTLDTFGEIAVVLIAALGAFVLLKGMRATKEEKK
ncbi:hydrogen gas-evolving membrane-bound hydrogenase subunit E [Natronohydrobacter thiooxidans]|uniref:hydrogen gas-evolving membrane-bound hydrogenase subunit E n=1 Tax=Natronohydrobacter thiooxidans TaxID=87172 RepID=UPI0008FF3ECB|nr:hydrogen gas-evolving membrane-bound hydrogenase subunit E [Natronohydrobacter thiooxidans]